MDTSQTDSYSDPTAVLDELITVQTLPDDHESDAIAADTDETLP